MTRQIPQTLSIGLSVLIAIQPFSPAFGQEPERAAPGAAEAGRAHFLEAHQRARAEARAREAGLLADPAVSYDTLLRLVQQKVKYVFVIYQENRSFDSYFGTFPGANGLFSQAAADTPGFVQNIVNTDGSTGTISPFRIGPSEYAADTDDIDHSHARLVAKMDIQNNVAQMDKFAVTEELKYSPTGNPSLKAKQYGELAMAYEDCDTVPLLWAYADRFVLFDNIFQSMTGPSTPGNLAIIGAQTGQTQWALHPSQAPAVPVFNDNDPFWGSPSDKSANPLPVNPGDFPGYGIQVNLTFATLPLSTLLSTAASVTAADRSAATDLVDVQDDITLLSKLMQPAVGFGWYEEGFDKEVTDNAGPVTADGSHASYITHHNGPQYFGYIANNPALRSELHYDRVPPPIVYSGLDQSSYSYGPRVPLILISPYAKLGYISHAQGSHGSVVKFVDAVFGLPPLATLPDELLGRYLAFFELGQDNVGPDDAITPSVSDLLDAFDVSRLLGVFPPLGPEFVMVAQKYVNTIPQTSGLGCADLGITTTDRQLGVVNRIPTDFNPRPNTNPSPVQ